MLAEACDVVVIGGGPAGAVAGALLAAAGVDVIIAEQKLFPRQKVCGEFLSPGSFPVLTRLGVLSDVLDRAGPEITALTMHPSVGLKITAAMPCDAAGRYARGVGRHHLDTILLDRARRLGARVLAPCHVRKVAGSSRDGYAVHTDQCGTIDAKLVIFANGLPPTESKPVQRSEVMRQMVGFKTYFDECRVPENVIGLYGCRGIYGGLQRTGDASGEHRYNFAFVARRSVMESAGGADSLLSRLRQANHAMDRALAGARRVDRWYAWGPLRPGVRRLFDDGKFYVGNAAGEVQPLVGEGMTLAIRSGALVADTIAMGLRSGLTPAEMASRYEIVWSEDFSSRCYWGNWFAQMMTNPFIGFFGSLLGQIPPLAQWGVAASGKKFLTTAVAKSPSRTMEGEKP
jgi:flavin-dependent dehydrogenase